MPADLENDLLVLLNDVARQTRICADQMAQAHGLTRAQLVILARLERLAKRTLRPGKRGPKPRTNDEARLI